LRCSSNGVRIASSETVEKRYEKALTAKGAARLTA
jgi:hypothetical protein